jgi:hypothetical protein
MLEINADEKRKGTEGRKEKERKFRFRDQRGL